MKKIKSYVKEQSKLPEIVSLSHQKVEFEKISSPVSDTGFKTTNPIIPGQKKQHLFRNLIFQVSINRQLYKVTVSSPLEGISHLTTVILLITISTIFFIILFSVFVNRYILSKLWLPFYDALAILRNFRIDNPQPLSFPATKTDEFNFMIDNLKAATTKEAETYQSLKEFTENASHEIQTPLAIIRSKLDILIQKEGLSSNESETSRSVYSAIDKLSKLSQSLLLITKIENKKFENKKSINLTDKLLEKMEQFQELWQINNIEIFNGLEKAEIVANEYLIDILLNNLLSNATRHNAKKGEINIALQQGILSVENPGAATPLDEQRIFKRFYKDAPHSNNNGLGLSIIKQICEASGISIDYQFLANRHTFTLTW